MPELVTPEGTWSWQASESGNVTLYYMENAARNGLPPIVITIPPMVAEMIVVSVREATPIQDKSQKVLQFPRTRWLSRNVVQMMP